MDTILVGTRKGLFTLRGGEIARVSFLGAPVTAVLARDGALHAAVGHGHFGAKLHRSRDDGETWWWSRARGTAASRSRPCAPDCLSGTRTT